MPLKYALSHLEGPTRMRGEPRIAKSLAYALEGAVREPRDTFTHGFHSYPARMHPAVAKAVLTELVSPTSSVLDPFCGSGTVLIEAMALGNRSFGSDINPLSVWLASVKTELRSKESVKRFESALQHVMEQSFERVRSRVRPEVPLPRSELRWYEPHVLLELSGLYQEIMQVSSVEDQRALQMVFSAIVVKFSKQRSDTSPTEAIKRIRKGLVTEFFFRKGLELMERWQSFASTVPAKTPSPIWKVADVRDLPWCEPVNCIITSPPYGGTYDYVDHHARRMAWLGIDARWMSAHEIGARRFTQSSTTGVQRWSKELEQGLRALSRCLCPAGLMVLLLGDAEVGQERIFADAQIAQLAPKVGLRWMASASQKRPDWRGKSPRNEHLIACVKQK